MHVCPTTQWLKPPVGGRWIAYRGIRVPKISRLVEIFLHATGTWVFTGRNPSVLACTWRDEMPVQNLDGIRRDIIFKLDEVAMQCTSPIAWDQFAFPQMDQECWREEALCYHPGKTLDVGMHMLGFRLMLQDDKGEYPHSGRTLIFKGSMLVYDPQ